MESAGSESQDHKRTSRRGFGRIRFSAILLACERPSGLVTPLDCVRQGFRHPGPSCRTRSRRLSGAQSKTISQPARANTTASGHVPVGRVSVSGPGGKIGMM
jgi:hypothetical protein